MDSKRRSRPGQNTGRKSRESARGSDRRHEPDATDVKKTRRQMFIIIGIVVVALLGIVAVPYYQNYVAPFNRIIITVDDEQVSARYFLERAQIAGSDPMTMLESLTNELVIKIMAPQYGIQVTDDDIELELRDMASDGAGDISDIEFKEWYRQRLNDTKLSDSRYRELVGINLLKSRLQDYLAERVPTEAEQFHLHIIVLSEYEEALDAKARLDTGEDFATVAREVSVDEASRESGGDLGWLPPVISIFADQIAYLKVNQPSAAMPYYSNTYSTSSNTGSTTPDFYYILMISEKDNARALTDEHRQLIQQRALEFWLREEIPQHAVSYNFNSEIYAWLSWQLQKSTASD